MSDRPCPPPGARLVRVAATALVLVVLQGGCAAPGAPRNPTWTGLDTVGEVPAEALVGDWRLTVLNPPDGRAPDPATVRYSADGRFRGEIVPTGDSVKAIGPDPFTIDGRWRTEGDLLIHEEVSITGSPGNRLAQRVAEMMNADDRALGGTADIQLLESDRIVMLGIEDGVATELRRGPSIP